MNKVTNYFRESYDELVHKVSWPTWTELFNSAALVLIGALIIATIVFGIDSVIGLALRTVFYR